MTKQLQIAVPQEIPYWFSAGLKLSKFGVDGIIEHIYKIHPEKTYEEYCSDIESRLNLGEDIHSMNPIHVYPRYLRIRKGEEETEEGKITRDKHQKINELLCKLQDKIGHKYDEARYLAFHKFYTKHIIDNGSV